MNLQDWTEIGTRIVKRRKELRLSKKAISEFLGISICTYTKMEQGRMEFSISQMQKICQHLHISPEYF